MHWNAHLLQSIKEDFFLRWSILPLFSWGRMAILKINILWRISFLPGSVPWYIMKHWFDNMNRIFSFLRKEKKKPLIIQRKLAMLRHKCRLRISDVCPYHFAFHARYHLTWGYKKIGRKRYQGRWDWLGLADKTMSTVLSCPVGQVKKNKQKQSHYHHYGIVQSHLLKQRTTLLSSRDGL